MSCGNVSVLFLFHPIPSDHQSLSSSIRAVSYWRITISQSLCGSPRHLRPNQSTACRSIDGLIGWHYSAVNYLQWERRKKKNDNRLWCMPLRAQLNSSRHHPKLAVRQLGRSNGYLYELFSASQQFITEGGRTVYLWCGDLHKSWIVMSGCVQVCVCECLSAVGSVV